MSERTQTIDHLTPFSVVQFALPQDVVNVFWIISTSTLFTIDYINTRKRRCEVVVIGPDAINCYDLHCLQYNSQYSLPFN